VKKEGSKKGKLKKEYINANSQHDGKYKIEIADWNTDF
jgi:hypothetical protein